MGGYGSGSWNRTNTKALVSDCLRLDASSLQRGGLFRSDVSFGSIFKVAWTKDTDDSSPQIGIQVGIAQITLLYRIPNLEEENGDIQEAVQLVWTPCNYGGHRAWFLCPGIDNGNFCGKRVTKLYLYGRYFLCRKCHGLTYNSQKVAIADRHLRRAQNIRMRLGGSASLIAPFPNKPKGMHWNTYWKMWSKEIKETNAHIGIIRTSLDHLEKEIRSGT